VSGLLKQIDLQEWTGIKRPSDLEAALKAHGIAYLKLKGKICTTVEAVNRALHEDGSGIRFTDGTQT
jgi:hypothetical protein